MDVAGGRRELPWNGNRIVRVTGCGPIAGGIGTAMNRGGGPVTIMDDGIIIRFITGFGFPDVSGLLRGYPGGPVALT